MLPNQNKKLKRVFIAINLPPDIKSRLEQTKQEIIASFPEDAGQKVAKWVSKDNLHITLLFLGQISQEKIEKVRALLKKAAQKQGAFEIIFKNVSYDKQRGIPRLIWVEIEKNRQLGELALLLNQEIASRHCQQPSFKWKGHITLARIR